MSGFFTLWCASNKFCLQWNWNYPFFETQNLRYITQLDKREKNRGNIIGAIKMGTGKLPMWTLQVLFKWTRIYLRHTCIWSINTSTQSFQVSSFLKKILFVYLFPLTHGKLRNIKGFFESGVSGVREVWKSLLTL